MIDYIKCSIPSKYKKQILRNRSLGDAVESNNSETGENLTTVYKFDNMRLIIKHNSNRILLNGSIHRFFTDCNSTDFNYLDLCSAINRLSERLNVPASEMRLLNFEFGINIEPSRDVDLLLERLISSPKYRFTPMAKRKNGSIGYISELSQATIKIYNKGKQLDLKQNLMRLEIKVTKLDHINKRKGISQNVCSLEDLKELNLQKELAKVLLDTISRIDFLEPTDNSQILSKKELQLYHLAKNKAYWEDLKRTFLDSYKYQRRQLSQLIKQLDHANSIKTEIIQKLGQKYNQLLINESLENESGFVAKTTSTYPLYSKVSYTKEKEPKVCQNCAQSIEGKRKQAKFCSKKCRNAWNNSKHNSKRKQKN
jgi:hypothetical protein